MKTLAFRSKRKSNGNQIDTMKKWWPKFALIQNNTEGMIWVGKLKPIQKEYKIEVCWAFDGLDRPYVELLNPVLKPREGMDFEDIPHLMFNNMNPESSKLCLFDPDRKEWSDNMFIHNTTIPWTSKWLWAYELWHFDGKWRGGGVGAKTVREAREIEAIHEAAKKHPIEAEK